MVASLLFYFLVFIAVFAINTLACRQKNRKRRIALIALGFIVLVCLLGFREHVGTDYHIYLAQYRAAGEKGLGEILTSRLEVLISLLYKFLLIFSLPDRIILFVYAILSLLPIYIANKEYNNKYLAHSILLYCVFILPLSMNAMRQGVSISLILLAFVYLNTGKNKRAIAAAIFAALFHLSAAATLPYILLFLFCKKKEKNFLKYSLIFTAVVAIFVLFLLKLIPIHTRYSYIIDAISPFNLSITSMATFLPAIAIPFIFKKGNKETRAHFAVSCSGLIYNFIGSAAQYLNRFSDYFISSLLFGIPMSLHGHKFGSKKQKVAFVALYASYLVVFFLIQYVHWNRHQILPYRTWLF